MSHSESLRKKETIDFLTEDIFFVPKPERLQGKLTKLGFKSGKWQERLFDLQAHILVYLGGPLKLVPNGQIPLEGAQVEAVNSQDPIDPLACSLAAIHGIQVGKQWGFKIKISSGEGSGTGGGSSGTGGGGTGSNGNIDKEKEKEKGRVFYLAAHSEEERQAWIVAIKNNVRLIEGEKLQATFEAQKDLGVIMGQAINQVGIMESSSIPENVQTKTKSKGRRTKKTGGSGILGTAAGTGSGASPTPSPPSSPSVTPMKEAPSSSSSSY